MCLVDINIHKFNIILVFILLILCLLLNNCNPHLINNNSENIISFDNATFILPSAINNIRILGNKDKVIEILNKGYSVSIKGRLMPIICIWQIKSDIINIEETPNNIINTIYNIVKSNGVNNIQKFEGAINDINYKEIQYNLQPINIHVIRRVCYINNKYYFIEVSSSSNKKCIELIKFLCKNVILIN